MVWKRFEAIAAVVLQKAIHFGKASAALDSDIGLSRSPWHQ